MLNPELVLCGGCRGREDTAARWGAYAAAQSGALLVRDVCAAQACPELQVRGHLCVAHVRQAELARQRCLPLRACSFCRRDVVQLYSAQQDVWFICAANDATAQALGAEEKAGPATARRRKSRARRLSRKVRANKQKERLLALDWSLGNIPIKPMFLWKENRRRLDDEERRQRDDEDADDEDAPSSMSPPLVYAYPDPTGVFCAVENCRHFAKTGDRCRFHSDRPASFYLLLTAAAVATERA